MPLPCSGRHATTATATSGSRGRETLASMATGVLLDVTTDFHREAEKLEPEFEPLVEEFGFWRELRDRLDGEAGRS
jgi:hypothetical protein